MQFNSGSVQFNCRRPQLIAEHGNSENLPLQCRSRNCGIGLGIGVFTCSNCGIRAGIAASPSRIAESRLELQFGVAELQNSPWNCSFPCSYCGIGIADAVFACSYSGIWPLNEQPRLGAASRRTRLPLAKLSGGVVSEASCWPCAPCFRSHPHVDCFPTPQVRRTDSAASWGRPQPSENDVDFVSLKNLKKTFRRPSKTFQRPQTDQIAFGAI